MQDDLQKVSESTLHKLFAHGREARYAAGERLPGRDEGFSGIRLIGEGEITVLARLAEEELPVWRYGAGDALGVRDFLRPESEPRIAWRAESDCLVLEIDAAHLTQALQQDADGELRQWLEEAAHLRDLEITMAVHPLFRLLSETERHALFDAATPKALTDGELLVQAGRANRALYLVTTGRLDIERDGVVIGARETGDLVGEVSALGFTPTADVRARGWVEVLAFDRDPVLDLCEANSAFADRLAREGLSIPPAPIPSRPTGHE